MFHDFRRHGIENVSLTELGPISKKAEPSRRSPLCDSRRGGIRVNPHALPTHSFSLSATIRRRDAGNQGKIGSESEQRGDPWRNQYRLDRVSITPRKYNKDASPPPRPCGVGRCPKRRDNGRGPGHPVGLNPLSARRPLPPCRRRNTLRQRQRENRVSEIQPEPANGCLSRRVPRPTSREHRPRFYQLSFARVLSPPPLCGSLTAVTLSQTRVFCAWDGNERRRNRVTRIPATRTTHRSGGGKGEGEEEDIYRSVVASGDFDDRYEGCRAWWTTLTVVVVTVYR